MAVGYLGIQPSEFFRMRPQEFYLLWEARRPRRPWEYKGTLTENELEELYQMIHEDN